MNTSSVSRLLAATGILAGITYFVGGHVLQPSGEPSQRMTDAEIVQWAHDGYGALWAGGVVSLVSSLLLLGFGVSLVDRLAAWSPRRLAADIARASVQLTSGLLALAGMAQLFSGAVSMPSEHLESESLVPVLVVLYGSLAASAWCLLAPAAICVALAVEAPRWARVVSGILGAALVVTFALPPVSWFFGILWVAAISCALLARPIEVHAVRESAGSASA